MKRNNSELIYNSIYSNSVILPVYEIFAKTHIFDLFCKHYPSDTIIQSSLTPDHAFELSELPSQYIIIQCSQPRIYIVPLEHVTITESITGTVCRPFFDRGLFKPAGKWQMLSNKSLVDRSQQPTVILAVIDTAPECLRLLSNPFSIQHIKRDFNQCFTNRFKMSAFYPFLKPGRYEHNLSLYKSQDISSVKIYRKVYL